MPDSPPDPDAEFVALLTEHQSALRFYVASLLPGDPSVADVAQQANTTVWKKRVDFTMGTNFKAWLFSVARYEVLNYRKRQARDSRLVFSEELEDIIADELPQLADDLDERQDALRACLANLKDAERDLILHRYYHRSPLKEYSAKVGRPVGSLKVTLHRIRAKLASCIQSKMAVGEIGKGAGA